jgi:hypothetical protein
LEIKYFNIGASTYFWHTRQTWLARVTISTRNTPLTRLQVLALAKFARVAIPYLKVKKLTKAGMKSIHNIFRRVNLKNKYDDEHMRLMKRFNHQFTWNVPNSDCLIERRRNDKIFGRVELRAHDVMVVTS